MSSTNTTHILVFPFPAQGHMLPLLDLTHELAGRGFKITILVTPKNLSIVSPLLSSHPTSMESLVLPLPPHPDIPLGVENVKDIGNAGNGPIMASLSKLEGEVIQWFKSHPSPPQVIISDFFLGCTQKWAENLSIPRIAFFSSGAFLTSVFNFLLLNLDTIRIADTMELTDLPRSPSFRKNQLPSVVVKGMEKPEWKAALDGLFENLKSWGSIFNTFSAFEGDYLEHLKMKLRNGHVFGVGPLSLAGKSAGLRMLNQNSNNQSDNSVLNWLDQCPDESVLYVSFGSQKLLTTPHIKALASALQRSNTRFVWVVKNHDWNSAEFEKQVEERGLVVRNWAPQMQILNHRAVVGFVSHCGWNSVLESLASGVMILAWPMEADQFVNAKLLVQDMQLAVLLCEGEHTFPDADELAKIMSDTLGAEIPQKKRAKSMKEKALEAVTVGGSSSKDLDELVKELNKLAAG